LPDDASDLTVDVPQPLPQPYTKASMYGYLHDGNVTVDGTGTTFTYSNMAPSLLANAIPVAVGSDLDFASLLAQEITAPLGMKSTRPFMDVSFTELPQGFSNGQAINAGWNEFPAFTGGSAMVSTANDMLLWLRFHMGMTDSPLKSILAPMQTPSTPVTYQGNLGIGWFLTNITATNDGQPVSLPIVYKAGELYGNSSFLCFLQSADPGKVPSQAGIIFLTNNMVDEAGAMFVLQLMLAMNGYPNATNINIG
jgi:CubicO group peptidase (beta-lactamase class C family)